MEPPDIQRSSKVSEITTLLLHTDCTLLVQMYFLMGDGSLPHFWVVICELLSKQALTDVFYLSTVSSLDTPMLHDLQYLCPTSVKFQISATPSESFCYHFFYSRFRRSLTRDDGSRLSLFRHFGSPKAGRVWIPILTILYTLILQSSSSWSTRRLVEPALNAGFVEVGNLHPRPDCSSTFSRNTGEESWCVAPRILDLDDEWTRAENTFAYRYILERYYEF
jgi:hypothetical protein